MKVFMIASKDVVIRFRDRKGLMLMVLMPLLLTAILGAALSNMIGGDQNLMPKMTISVYSEDNGELARRLVDDVLQSEELNPYIKIKMLASSKEVLTSIENGKGDVGIIIPKDFSQNVFENRATKIEVLQDPGKETAGQIVSSIVTSYTNRAAAVAIASKEVIEDLAMSIPVAQPSNDFQQIIRQVTAELQEAALSANAKVIEQPIGKNPVSGMQYYAAAMAAMFLLFNATVGAKSILNERSTETLARLINTPTSRGSILLGKFFGTLIYSVVQFFIFMGVTHFLYGVNWGEDLLQSILIGICYSFAVSGLSMAIAAMISSETAADIVAGIGVQILSALGGSMVPISMFPELLRKIAHITPNYWALNSFVDIMGGTSWQTLLMPVSILMSIGLVSLLIGTWRLKAH